MIKILSYYRPTLGPNDSVFIVSLQYIKTKFFQLSILNLNFPAAYGQFLGLLQNIIVVGKKFPKQFSSNHALDPVELQGEHNDEGGDADDEANDRFAARAIVERHEVVGTEEEDPSEDHGDRRGDDLAAPSAAVELGPAGWRARHV